MSSTLELNDNALLSLSLREHAQTCSELAERYPPTNKWQNYWMSRADRCRALAMHFERLNELDASRTVQ